MSTLVAAPYSITYTVVMSGQVIDNALYSYDASGALVRTIATTATLNGNGTIQSSGAYTDTYAYDPLGQPLFLIRQQNGTTKGYTYLLDGHGSVVGLVDSAGNRVDRYQYAPYGAPGGLGFWETVPQLFRNDGTTADPGLGLTDPDGNPKNCCSDTSILANKAVGFLSYITFNADPLDYELGARRLVNGLITGPIVGPADAGVGVGAGVGTAVGTVCVGTVIVPVLGEIDCATAVLYFGVAFVAALFFAQHQAVPIPIPNTGTTTRPRNSKGPNYVVRGGEAKPRFLIEGYKEHTGVPGLFGLSVQYAPGSGLSEDELARFGQFSNGQISYATDVALEAAVDATGYTMVLVPSPGQSPYHATLEVINPEAGRPKEILPPSVAEALSLTFQRKTNPFRIPYRP